MFGAPGWRLIDLDTGVRLVPSGLPSPNTGLGGAAARYTVTAVPSGLVMIVQGRTTQARFYAVSAAGAVSEPVDLGPADVVLPAGRPDRVWLVDGGGEGDSLFPGPVPGFANDTLAVRLVDLRGPVLQSFEVESEWLWTGVEQGVALERGGRVYLADEDGLQAIAIGHVLGAIDSDLLVASCDDAGACGIERQPPDGGSAQRLGPVSHVDPQGYAVAAADGRLAVGRISGESADLVVVAADGQTQATIADASTISDVPVWLPGGVGFVAAAEDKVRWVRPTGGEWLDQPLPPALDDLDAQLIFLVDW